MALSGSPFRSASAASAWRCIAASKPRRGSSSVPILSLSEGSRPNSGEDPCGASWRPKMLRSHLRTNEEPPLRTCPPSIAARTRLGYSGAGLPGRGLLCFNLPSPEPAREEHVGLRVCPLPQDPERLGAELVSRRTPGVFSDGDHRRPAGLGGRWRGSLVAGAADLLRGARRGGRVLAYTRQAPLRHGRRGQREDAALLAGGRRGH